MQLATPAEFRAQKDALLRARPRATLLRMFVGGSSDVAAERDRVQEVVNRLHAVIGDELRLDVLRWENYDTPQWQPPQDAIFGNVRFDEIDLFVGVFWWRVGTPTGKLADGVEYPGGTFAELARAKALYAAGKVRRILLYFCDRPFPDGADPAQRGGIEALRAELEAGPDRAFFRTFTTLDEFAWKLNLDLHVATDEFLPRRRSVAAVVPDLVAKLCDRYEQEADFADFFITGLRDHRGTVQACVLWGDKGEGHESFVERLVAIRLRRLADRAWPGENAQVEDHQPPWPEGKNVEEMQRRLTRMLVDHFDEGYMDRDLSARAVTRLVATRGVRLLVLHHEVEVARWSTATERLLEWYLDEYWGALPPDPMRAEILLIIKLVYTGRTGAEGKAARQRLRPRLEALCRPRPGGCRRILLPELDPVRRKHVEQWLERHCDVDDSYRARMLARELFEASENGEPPPRSMEALEGDLRDLLARLARAPAGAAAG